MEDTKLLDVASIANITSSLGIFNNSAISSIFISFPFFAIICNDRTFKVVVVLGQTLQSLFQNNIVLMANTLTSIIFFFLFFLSAAGIRAKSLSTSDFSFYGNDGICSSMVERQGYACEEHKV